MKGRCKYEAAMLPGEGIYGREDGMEGRWRASIRGRLRVCSFQDMRQIPPGNCQLLLAAAAKAPSALFFGLRIGGGGAA
jgi:hypothetical protein